MQAQRRRAPCSYVPYARAGHSRDIGQSERNEQSRVSDDPCEYIPDIITDFCEKKGIDEYERTIGILAYNFEKNEQSNYNMWESKILNKYYDAIIEDHNPFQFSHSSL